MDKKFKLLIINGGGIYGAIPARFLSYVGKQDWKATEPESTHDLDGVDAVAGCSIGAILAAAYASGKGFKEIDDTFQCRAGDCFARRWQSVINPLSSPKYKSEALYEVIKDMVGTTTMGQVKKIYPDLKVIIPCLDITVDQYKVFENISGNDDCVCLEAVAKMSSAAPTYFQGVNYSGHCVVDGGLIEVNPLLTAITTIKGKMGIDFKDIDVLMLGVGNDVSPKQITLDRYNDYNMLDVCLNVIVPYVTLSNSMATLYWGNNIGLNSFKFWNPIPTTGDLDAVSQIPELITKCDTYKEDFIEIWNEWINK